MRTINSKFNILSSKFGYTMIELLVTIGITGLIAAIVLANYPKLSEQLAVSRTAYEIALAFREAKTYAIAVRQYAGSYQIGYGVHFDLATPQSFILYAAPLNNDNTCNASVSGSCARGSAATYDVDAFTMKSGIKIAGIYDIAGTPIELQKLDVAYVRPDPKVYLTGVSAGGGVSYPNKVEIKIVAPGGTAIKSVIVNSVGQIYVK